MCFCLNTAFCQKNIDIPLSFKITFNNKPVILNDSTYLSDNGNAIKFEVLKFYISNIRLYKNNVSVWTEENSFHLYDAFNNADTPVNLNVASNISYNSISFNLGIDSLTNVSGAMGGDLDPTKGMYWAWQSGYINFKVEGKSDRSTDLRKEFQFHLGGYQSPFNALQTVSLRTVQKETIVILFDLSTFMHAVNLAKQHHIMSPAADAVKLSNQAAKCFSIKP